MSVELRAPRAASRESLPCPITYGHPEVRDRATKMIPSFIADELSFRELEQFMEHIDECESCKEELSIQFLVEVGLNSLEAGNTFDLQQELNIALEEAAKRVQVYRFFRHSAFVLACVGIAAAILGAALLLLYFLG